MLVMYLALIDTPTDREKFTMIYTEHHQKMFYFANQILRDEMLAEDAVHEAFLRLAKNIDRFDLTRDATNLMLTIVRHIALSMKSRRSREVCTFDYVGSGFEQVTYDLEKHYTARLELHEILKAIDSMPHEYGAVFRLRYIHDMSYSQIACALDITQDAAKKRIQRIREHLKEMKAEGDLNGNE